MRDVPEDEMRLLLGGNAVRFFGLDRDMLQRHAERVGPAVSDIKNSEPVPQELVDILHWRASFMAEHRVYDSDTAASVILADQRHAAAAAP
jgi:hypothetical protein